MAGLVALFVVIIVSWVIVTVAGTMLELTGLDPTTARFQALSAFSGTGFTTRASELVVRHPVRRRIVASLMVLGNAGTASLVASLIGTFNQDHVMDVALNALLLVVFAMAMVTLARHFGTTFARLLRLVLGSAMTGQQVAREELMLFREGFGLVRAPILADGPLDGVSLRASGLRHKKLEVLAIEDGLSVTPVPDPDHVFRPGQWALVYGATEQVEEAFGPPA